MHLRQALNALAHYTIWTAEFDLDSCNCFVSEESIGKTAACFRCDEQNCLMLNI